MVIAKSNDGRQIEWNGSKKCWVYSDTKERYTEEPVEDFYLVHNFASAIESLKKGKLIARSSWNFNGTFVFKQVPTEIDKGIVPKMTSLPSIVKDEFIRRDMNLNYQDQLCIVSMENGINSWTASAQDIFAEDWIIF